jgi:SOS-response transcriptional repressor LexA
MNADMPGVSEHTGFPNAATDRSLAVLDLHALLVKNSSSTFFMRVDSNQWAERGVYDGDIAIIDRALISRPSDLVVLWREGTFTIMHFKRAKEGDEVWGVVTTLVHRLRS